VNYEYEKRDKKFGITTIYILPNSDNKCDHCYATPAFIGGNNDFVEHINSIYSIDLKTTKQAMDYLDSNNIKFFRQTVKSTWNSIKPIYEERT
jgi:hypothetical protein